MRRKTGLTIMLAILMVLPLLGCKQSNTAPRIADDEILLLIQLDIKEDIGLLVVDFHADGFNGSGGTSNANKSLLKHDELIYYTLGGEDYKNLPDVTDLLLQFTIITEYCDPNYENSYPKEYSKPLDAINLDATFGESYCITITGDRKNGYTAVLDQ